MIIDHSLTVSGSHVVRLYLWDMLEKFMPDIWQKQNPNDPLSKIPIIPSQEQPEWQTSDKPYMIYVNDYSPTAGELWQYQHETMMITMYSQSSATIAATSKLCARIFNRYDETAADINAWLWSDTGLGKYAMGDTEYDAWIDEYRNFQFKTVSIDGITGAQPSGGEGRRVDAEVTISLSYIEHDMNNLYGDDNTFA